MSTSEPCVVEEGHYLGEIGWKSCIDRHGLRDRGLPDSKWGYWLLLKDVTEIGRTEETYLKGHDELPRVMPRKRDRRPTAVSNGEVSV